MMPLVTRVLVTGIRVKVAGGLWVLGQRSDWGQGNYINWSSLGSLGPLGLRITVVIGVWINRVIGVRATEVLGSGSQ